MRVFAAIAVLLAAACSGEEAAEPVPPPDDPLPTEPAPPLVEALPEAEVGLVVVLMPDGEHCAWRVFPPDAPGTIEATLTLPGECPPTLSSIGVSADGDTVELAFGGERNFSVDPAMGVGRRLDALPAGGSTVTLTGSDQRANFKLTCVGGSKSTLEDTLTGVELWSNDGPCAFWWPPM